jgi:hypothetical protein
LSRKKDVKCKTKGERWSIRRIKDSKKKKGKKGMRVECLRRTGGMRRRRIEVNSFL